MKRVAIINLAGRAYHVEEAGAERIDVWLADARSLLGADPDCDELVGDFERAIADRCERHVTDPRDVVTEASIIEVLGALGPVVPISEDGAPADPTTEAPPPSDPASPNSSDSWRERKLYRITGGEEMLGGVCAGLAAYLRMDVTVVRVIVATLTIISGGIGLLVYIAMALIVPEAHTDAERAQARGYGDTAQELIARARDNAGPALTELGALFRKLLAATGVVIRWVGIAATWCVLTLWAVGIAWVFVKPSDWQSVFDAGTSSWTVALLVTCIAWIAVSACLSLVWLGAHFGPPQDPRGRSEATSTILGVAWGAATAAALVGAILIPATSSEPIRDLTDGRGRIEIADQGVCFVDLSERAAKDEYCKPGDEIADVG